MDVGEPGIGAVEGGHTGLRASPGEGNRAAVMQERVRT